MNDMFQRFIWSKKTDKVKSYVMRLTHLTIGLKLIENHDIEILENSMTVWMWQCPLGLSLYKAETSLSLAKMSNFDP